MAISKKLFIDQLPLPKLNKLLAGIDKAIRLERLKRVFCFFAQHEDEVKRERRLVILREKLERETKMLELRKAAIDEALEEIEALVDLE